MHPQERTALCHVCHMFVFVCVSFSFVYARFSHGLATANTTPTHLHQHTFKVSPADILAGQILSLEMTGYLMITQGRQRLLRQLLTRDPAEQPSLLYFFEVAVPPAPLHPDPAPSLACGRRRPVGPPSLFSSVMAVLQPVTLQSIVYSSAGRPETV